MKNYQLYRTNTALSGQIQWNFVLGKQDTTENTTVKQLFLSPVDKNIPYITRDNLLSNNHSYNITQLYNDNTNSFYNITDDMMMGCERASDYSIYNKQFEFFCPVWIERINNYIRFDINIQYKDNIIISQPVVINISNPTTQLDEYFKEYIETIGLNDNGDERVINIGFTEKEATINGLSIISGSPVVRSIDYIANNLTTSEKILADFDGIITNAYSDNSLICKQLFNFNFKFNIDDIISHDVYNMSIIDNKLSDDIFISVNTIIDGYEIPKRDFYNNYFYIPKSIKYYNAEITTDIPLDKYETLKNTIIPLKDDITEQEKITSSFNVLKYLKDYDSKYYDKTINNKNIIHWSLNEDNNYIFNLYNGYAGIICELQQTSNNNIYDYSFKNIKLNHVNNCLPHLSIYNDDEQLNNINWVNNNVFADKIDDCKKLSTLLYDGKIFKLNDVSSYDSLFSTFYQTNSTVNGIKYNYSNMPYNYHVYTIVNFIDKDNLTTLNNDIKNINWLTKKKEDLPMDTTNAILGTYGLEMNNDELGYNNEIGDYGSNQNTFTDDFSRDPYQDPYQGGGSSSGTHTLPVLPVHKHIVDPVEDVIGEVADDLFLKYTIINKNNTDNYIIFCLDVTREFTASDKNMKIIKDRDDSINELVDIVNSYMMYYISNIDINIYKVDLINENKIQQDIINNCLNLLQSYISESEESELRQMNNMTIYDAIKIFQKIFSIDIIKSVYSNITTDTEKEINDEILLCLDSYINDISNYVDTGFVIKEYNEEIKNKVSEQLDNVATLFNTPLDESSVNITDETTLFNNIKRYTSFKSIYDYIINIQNKFIDSENENVFLKLFISQIDNQIQDTYNNITDKNTDYITNIILTPSFKNTLSKYLPEVSLSEFKKYGIITTLYNDIFNYDNILGMIRKCSSIQEFQDIISLLIGPLNNWFLSQGTNKVTIDYGILLDLLDNNYFIFKQLTKIMESVQSPDTNNINNILYKKDDEYYKTIMSDYLYRCDGMIKPTFIDGNIYYNYINDNDTLKRIDYMYYDNDEEEYKWFNKSKIKILEQNINTSITSDKELNSDELITECKKIIKNIYSTIFKFIDDDLIDYIYNQYDINYNWKYQDNININKYVIYINMVLK